MKYTKQYLMLLPIVVLSVLMSACVKSHQGEIDDPSTNRPFLPTSFSVKTAKDSAVFSWYAPVLSAGKKYTYTVDVSQDSSFAKIDFTKTVDTLGFLVLEPTLTVGKKYFARMRVNPFKGSEASRYAYLSRSFSINGLNYLRVIRDFEITTTTALIHWYINPNTTNLTKIVLSVNGSAVSTVDISPVEALVGAKLITGLSPDTKYSLQLFAGDKSRGIMSFATPATVNYTTTLNSGGDLAGAIAAAPDGAVIGLNPGTYSLASIVTMTGKTIAIRSTSNNPADTKIIVRQFEIAGNGAGLTLSGVDINGNYSGTTLGNYFLVLRGAAANGDPANFTDIKIDNCVIHDFLRSVILGNNATTVSTQTIRSISINNSIVYNLDKAGTSTYYTMSLEKLLFNSFNISKSTFYSVGAGMFNIGTTLAATTIVPTITVDYCTFNNFGGSGKYLFFDGVNNKISYTLRNSILANSPQSGTINAVAFRNTGTGSTLDFLNNDYFNLNSTFGATTPLSLTGLNQVNFYTVNLGWTAATTNFSLAAIPPTNLVMTASTNGSSIGDPRWAY